MQPQQDEGLPQPSLPPPETGDVEEPPPSAPPSTRTSPEPSFKTSSMGKRNSNCDNKYISQQYTAKRYLPDLTMNKRHVYYLVFQTICQVPTSLSLVIVLIVVGGWSTGFSRRGRKNQLWFGVEQVGYWGVSPVDCGLQTSCWFFPSMLSLLCKTVYLKLI